MTDFWCSTTVDCQKLFLFTLKHPAFLFPHSDEQLMTQHWCSKTVCLPLSFLHRTETPADVQGLYQRIPKQSVAALQPVFRKQHTIGL